MLYMLGNLDRHAVRSIHQAQIHTLLNIHILHAYQYCIPSTVGRTRGMICEIASSLFHYDQTLYSPVSTLLKELLTPRI